MAKVLLDKVHKVAQLVIFWQCIYFCESRMLPIKGYTFKTAQWLSDRLLNCVSQIQSICWNLFLRLEIFVDCPLPERGGGMCQTRLTKITRCLLLHYAGGAGFACAFTAPPARLKYLHDLHVEVHTMTNSYC